MHVQDANFKSFQFKVRVAEDTYNDEVRHKMHQAHEQLLAASVKTSSVMFVRCSTCTTGEVFLQL